MFCVSSLKGRVLSSVGCGTMVATAFRASVIWGYAQSPCSPSSIVLCCVILLYYLTIYYLNSSAVGSDSQIQRLPWIPFTLGRLVRASVRQTGLTENQSIGREIQGISVGV